LAPVSLTRRYMEVSIRCGRGLWGHWKEEGWRSWCCMNLRSITLLLSYLHHNIHIRQDGSQTTKRITQWKYLRNRCNKVPISI